MKKYITITLALITLASCVDSERSLNVEKVEEVDVYEDWDREYDSLGNLKTLKQYKIGYTEEKSLNQNIEYFENGEIDYSKSLFVDCSINSDTIKTTDSRTIDFTGHFMTNNDLIVLSVLVNGEKINERETKDTVFSIDVPSLGKEYELMIKILCLKKIIFEGKEELAGPEIWVKKHVLHQKFVDLGSIPAPLDF
jgi:hypothetical protein